MLINARIINIARDKFLSELAIEAWTSSSLDYAIQIQILEHFKISLLNVFVRELTSSADDPSALYILRQTARVTLCWVFMT
jgi:hypothetical protein